MSANLGTLDRVLRTIIGLALILAPLTNIPAIWDSAGSAFVSMGVGAIIIATSLFRFCPLYQVLGISTCKI